MIKELLGLMIACVELTFGVIAIMMVVGLVATVAVSPLLLIGYLFGGL